MFETRAVTGAHHVINPRQVDLDGKFAQPLGQIAPYVGVPPVIADRFNCSPRFARRHDSAQKILPAQTEDVSRCAPRSCARAPLRPSLAFELETSVDTYRSRLSRCVYKTFFLPSKT